MSFNEIIQMVFNSFLTALLGVIISIIVLYFYKKRRKEELQKPIRTFFFLLYMYMLINVTIFRGSLFLNEIHSINLIPFNKLLISSHYQLEIWGKKSAFLIFSYNVFGNIIWFVPFGLLLCTISNKMNLLKAFFYSLLLSLGIEACQYVFYTGISDIDDVIFNVIGGIIGYYIYKYIRIKKKNIKEKVNL